MAKIFERPPRTAKSTGCCRTKLQPVKFLLKGYKITHYERVYFQLPSKCHYDLSYSSSLENEACSETFDPLRKPWIEGIHEIPEILKAFNIPPCRNTDIQHLQAKYTLMNIHLRKLLMHTYLDPDNLSIQNNLHDLSMQ